MDGLRTRAQKHHNEVRSAITSMKIVELSRELAELREKTMQADFWNDNLSAQETMRQISQLESRTRPWLDLQKNLDDILELINTDDKSLEEDLVAQFADSEKAFAELKSQLRFSGQYDEYDAILSIYAGAGGTDAQDWAQMLMRMYIRWAEVQGSETKIIDESAGEEAGIKSVTLEINGDFTFGKLKGEHGVHRLVRLSPFNADNLRQTSFAKVEVIPKIDKPDMVAIDDKDLKIDVYRSGGHGGQSVNTTDSAVRVTHLPTGIVVAIQNERSQLQNRETALTILRSKLAQLQTEQHVERLSELKGPNQEASWGNQIRSYVLHPYKQVKDLRTGYISSEPDDVLDGKIDGFIDAYLEHYIGE